MSGLTSLAPNIVEAILSGDEGVFSPEANRRV